MTYIISNTAGINILLSRISAIRSKYELIAEFSGENFNIFRILKVHSAEVRLHSAFLAELLNPKGSHGHQDVFLKLFVEMFCKGNPIDTASSKVQIEKHAGSINEQGTEGGRIDIYVIDSQNNHILIENKIYAGDQFNQLLRYSNLQSKGTLIYLTLFGSDPSDNSKGTLVKSVDFECCSYKDDILKWLEQCRKEVVMQPLIRESITQYINLIKYLTNQSINQTMEVEITNTIRSNWEASFAIAGNLYNAKVSEINKFTSELETSLAGRNLIFEATINISKPYNGISVYKKEWKHVKINFEFQGSGYDLIYGFCTKEVNQGLLIPQKLREELSSITHDGEMTEGWPWYYRMEEPINNWQNPRAYEAMQDGTMKTAFLNKIDFLLRESENISGM